MAAPDLAAPPPVGTDRELRLHGHRIRVNVRPAADPAAARAAGRRPLVLVNGIGASLEMFEPLVLGLGPDREVIRFDVPGIGRSPAPLTPLPMSALAALVVDLLDQLGHGRADLLGLSWGGGIVQQFALQHPDRTGRLALVSTGMGVMMVPARLSVLTKMLTPRRYNDVAFRRHTGSEIYEGERQEDVEAVFARVLPVPARGYLYQLMALMSWTSLPVLPLIAAPTLVLAGRRDPVIPMVNAHLMGMLMRRATVHLHDGGHLAVLTRAGELAPLIEEFLDTR